MKLLLLLIPLLSFAQIKVNDKLTIPSDALHFYGSFGINEASYQIQSYAFPKWKPARKILVANGITLSCIFAKEWYDTKKKRPTGFSWDDIFVGCWSIPVYDIVRICINDFRKPKESIKLEP